MSKAILAIETCSEACSAALTYQGVTQQLITIDPRGHADNLLPMIDKLMSDVELSIEQLDAIAFTRGPGAFTGVRIGTSVAQGLAVAADIPLIAISSLKVLAQGCYRVTGQEHCLVALDARMSEVYFGIYQLEDKLMVALQNDQVAGPAAINCVNEQNYLSGEISWQAFGPGWNNYLEEMMERFTPWKVLNAEDVYFPEAIDLLDLAADQLEKGNVLDAADAQPVYLRDQVVR